jgi:hypothetical protein
MSVFKVLCLTVIGTNSIFANQPLITADERALQEYTQLSEAQLKPMVNFLAGEEVGCNWIKEYPLVAELIQKNGLKIGCEVGVAYGLQSKYILENTDVEKLYSVDPYLHRNDYQDFMNFQQKCFDVLYYKVHKRLSAFGKRSELIRKISVEAAAMFADHSLDFVYIDADHSYAAVKSDLAAWWSKVRSGGLVIGDDYAVFPTTKAAVDEFVKNNNLYLSVHGNKWWVVKP